MSSGTLIEVAGTLEKDAVDAVIDYVDAIDILSGLKVAPQPSAQKKGKGISKNKSSQSEIGYMRDILDKDRKRTPISNVVLRCSEPENLNVVATLRTENLRDLTLSELDRNNVRVVGKITRVIDKGEKMISFKNYGLSLLQPELLNQIFGQLTDAEELAVKFNDVQIEGPAFQVLPLMIFV